MSEPISPDSPGRNLSEYEPIKSNLKSLFPLAVTFTFTPTSIKYFLLKSILNQNY